MRAVIGAVLLTFVSFPSVMAQDPQPPTVTDEQRQSVSDERMARIRAMAEKGRLRQEAIDRQNQDLWTRWTYAVCIGCGPAPQNMRAVWTHPLRVLGGVPAAEDDARTRRGRLPV